MITLTRFDGTQFVLNSDIIQYVEKTPDTIVTMTTGDKLMVKESVENIVEAIIKFRQNLMVGVVELKRNENQDYIE
jgi:flagellar protein FlbD